MCKLAPGPKLTNRGNHIMDRRKRYLASIKHNHEESVELMNERMTNMSSNEVRALIQLADNMIDNERSFEDAVEKTVIAMDSMYVINEHNVRAITHKAGQKDGRNTKNREEQQRAQTIAMAFETLKLCGIFRK
jgi:hypothetical protein